MILSVFEVGVHRFCYMVRMNLVNMGCTSRSISGEIRNIVYSNEKIRVATSLVLCSVMMRRAFLVLVGLLLLYCRGHLLYLCLSIFLQCRFVVLYVDFFFV